MKKTLLILLAGVLALGVLLTIGWWYFKDEEPAWTTRSPEALQVFTMGLEDLKKYYWNDAQTHFERALELDSEFVAAQLFLASIVHSRDEQQRLLQAVKNARMDRLTTQEQFLIASHLAMDAGDVAKQKEIVTAYLEVHPTDPFALNQSCGLAWKAEDFDGAASCYQRLLELHPNWVQAQYRLGLVALSRGQFKEAEEQFRTYLYIAPDQANPYDALGLLLTLVGRYSEAEQALRQAIAIKPDLCEPYWDLTWLQIFSDQYAAAEVTLDHIEALDTCQVFRKRGWACAERTLVRLLKGDLTGAGGLVAGGCLAQNQGYYLAAHRLAVLGGRLDEAQQMEEAYGRQIEQAGVQHPYEVQGMRAELAHVQGIRLLYAGQFDQAVASLRHADELMSYWGNRQASFKLYNMLTLVYGLEMAGQERAGAVLREKIAAINPVFARSQLAELEGLLPRAQP